MQALNNVQVPQVFKLQGVGISWPIMTYFFPLASV